MEKLNLRKVTVEDSKIIYSWKQDEFFQRMALDDGYTTSIANQLQDIENSLINIHNDYQIITLDGVPIGYVRIDYIDEKHHSAWLRFALGTNRGFGYAGKALRIYLEKIFSTGTIRVEGEVYAYNVPSQKTLERLGFVREGTKRKAHYYNGEYVDVYIYGLLQEEFSKQK